VDAKSCDLYSRINVLVRSLCLRSLSAFSTVLKRVTHNHYVFLMLIYFFLDTFWMLVKTLIPQFLIMIENQFHTH